MKVLIIGYGVVGQNMHKLFPEAEVYDPAKGFDLADEIVDITTLSDKEQKFRTITDEPNLFDVGFICVPTDKLPDGSADASIVWSVVEAWHKACTVLVIKSTVPPGTTQRLISNGYQVVMSPEYFGATKHANAISGDFVILGGTRKTTSFVAELYKEHTAATFRIHKTSATMAELVKYSENAWIATKVTFVNEIGEFCATLGLDRDEWRELWLLDDRISRHHTYSYRLHPYYASHCLDKDVPALIAEAEEHDFNLPLIETVQMINDAKRDQS